MLKITNRNVFRQPEIKSDENKVLSPDMELALYKKQLENARVQISFTGAA